MQSLLSHSCRQCSNLAAIEVMLLLLQSADGFLNKRYFCYRQHHQHLHHYHKKHPQIAIVVRPIWLTFEWILGEAWEDNFNESAQSSQSKFMPLLVLLFGQMRELFVNHFVSYSSLQLHWRQIGQRGNFCRNAIICLCKVHDWKYHLCHYQCHHRNWLIER